MNYKRIIIDQIEPDLIILYNWTSYFRSKRKNGQKKKKKASRKAGTVENARLFRQPDNLRCKFQKIVLGGTLALVLHFQETDRLNLPCFWIFDEMTTY